MSPAAIEGSFSAPPQVVTFDGLLSDFDGTIVDSTDGELCLSALCYWHMGFN